MNTSKTKRLLIFYALLALLALAGYVFFFTYIEQTGTRISAAAAEIVKLQQQNQEYSSLNSLARNVKDSQAALDTYLVDKSKIVNFLEAVEGLKKTTGAAVTVQSIKEDDSKTVIKNLHLDISVNGTWEQVYRFLALLESMPFNITLDKATFGESGAGEWHGAITITAVELAQSQ